MIMPAPPGLALQIDLASDCAAYPATFLPRWRSSYPASRFWHVLHGCGAGGALRAALRESRRRGAGVLSVSPFSPPGPWDRPPSGGYWDALVAGLNGLEI
eukprot:tig00000053_g23491.t1